MEEDFEQTSGNHVSNMPYKSKKQCAYLHAKKPKLAKKWDKKYGKGINGKKVK